MTTAIYTRESAEAEDSADAREAMIVFRANPCVIGVVVSDRNSCDGCQWGDSSGVLACTKDNGNLNPHFVYICKDMPAKSYGSEYKTKWKAQHCTPIDKHSWEWREPLKHLKLAEFVYAITGGTHSV